MRSLAITVVIFVCGFAALAGWLAWSDLDGRRQAAAVVTLPPSTRKADQVPASPKADRPDRVYFDPALVEDSAHGPIPRIGPKGRRPADVYARSFPLTGDHPRVAVIVSGLGLKAKLTRAALKGLPPEVTLAFSAYAPQLYDWTRLARTDGHEVMIQAPMEPRDAATSDSGPKALLAGLTVDENRARLHWALSRFVGYVGVLGDRHEGLSGKPSAFVPLVDDVLGRGLLYVHPAAEAPALSGIGKDRGLLRVDLWLDESLRPETIDRRMRIAEALARGRGWVLVAARATPLTIDRIRQWTAALSQREMLAVPVTGVSPDALNANSRP